MNGKQLLQNLKTDRITVYDPVVAEVTEENTLLTGIGIGHLVADVYRLAEDGVVVTVPQGKTELVLQLAECKGGFVIHDPHRFLAVLGLHGEEQVNNAVIGEGIGSHTDLCALVV